ncbi:regulatory protein RecX [Leucobacter sp. HY1908]
MSAVPAAIPAGVEAECAEEVPADRGPAYDDAVRLLARRAKSSGELRGDLLALDHPADEVSLVIDEFIDSHYLDDLGLARVQAEKLRSSKGASRGQITRKLRERKLPDAVIDEVIGELDTDEEYALLREAAAKRAEKLGGLDRATAQRRLIGFLARRGWSGEPAMRAVNEALDGGGLGKRGRSGSGVRFE